MSQCLTDQSLRSLVDGALSDEEMSSVGNHLVQCEHCRQRADDLTNVKELIWARGMRGLSSDQLEISPAELAGSPREETAKRLAKLDFNHELDWLDPPREAGDLGAMGPYRVLRVLGYGGMGIVLLCRDATLDRMVAIKVLRSDRGDPRSRKRFVREGRSLIVE